MPTDTEDVYARWERALERRGVASVRLLLHVSSGPSAEVALRGLASEPPYPPLSFVEDWLARQESSRGRIGRRLLWPMILLIVGIGFATAAVIAGDLELPQIGWF